MNGKELLTVQKSMKGITPQSLFVCLMIGLGLFGVFWLCYTRGACMRTVLPSPEWYFMDFFNHIFYVQEPSGVYDVNFNACFPPLAYMLYWLLAQMLPADTVVMDDPSALTSYALLLYVTYYVLLGILLYDSIRRLYTARGGAAERQPLGYAVGKYVGCVYFQCYMDRKLCIDCVYSAAQGIGAAG